jgi:threonine dehydrogenase-like Zn-dependent dehydrogenase
MKAIVFDGTLKYRENYPVPEPGEKEVLVRVSLAGICNTDIEIMNGYLGFHGVMGHEFVGLVEGAPENAKNLVGKRVVGEINCGCGLCDFCKGGLAKHCPTRTTLGIQGKDGAFAEYVTLPVSNVHTIPDNIADEEAVFTEPLAAAFEITEQVHIKPTDRVLVLGDGKLGLLCSFVLGLMEADVTLAGKHEGKLSIAEKGHIRTLNRAYEKPHEKKYDIVVEATGSVEGFKDALQLTKPRGTIVLKSTVAATPKMDGARLVIDEIHVVGSRCGPFGPALRALAQRRIGVKPLISAIYTFDRSQEAFEKAQGNESLKIIIDFR